MHRKNMHRNNMDRKIVGFAGLLAISALSLGSPAARVASPPAAQDHREPGAPYVSALATQATPNPLDETGGNVISVFNRANDGTLRPAGNFPPAGLDSGARQPDPSLGKVGSPAPSDHQGSRGYSQSRIYRLRLHRQHPENAFVHSSQRLLPDKPL